MSSILHKLLRELRNVIAAGCGTMRFRRRISGVEIGCVGVVREPPGVLPRRGSAPIIGDHGWTMPHDAGSSAISVKLTG